MRVSAVQEVRHVTRRTTIVASACGALLLACGPAIAIADGPSPATARGAVGDVAAAVADQGLTAPITNAGSAGSLPAGTDDGLSLQTAAGQLTVGLPASGDATTVGRTAVFAGEGAQNRVLAQPLSDGARALVQITGPDAPTDYRFPIDGASRLQQQPNGSVLVYDADDQPAAMIDAPWAQDANANNVATSYSIDGTTLVQHVDHAGAAYPVIADPTVKKTIKRIIGDCIKGALGGASVEAIVRSLSTVGGAVRFVVRRLGFFAALGCAGSIIFDYI